LQQVVVDDPKPPIYQHNLGCLCTTLASVLAQQGRNREAIACLEQARSLFQKLVHSHPDDARYQEGVRSAEHDLAIIAQKKEH
jgi:hypothetical protein